MKKILLFSVWVMLVFSSCKKDSSKTTTSASITATIGSNNFNLAQPQPRRTTANTTFLPQIVYVENASVSNPVSFTSDISGSNFTTITITSISSSNIQGTFSSTLVSDQDYTTTKTLTNGKFNVGVIATKMQ